MGFYPGLLRKYSELIPPARYEELVKVDKHIMWYLADEEQNFVTVNKKEGRHIVEFDITSAFPTICRCLFAKDDPFIIEMNRIHEKKGKNIFIATTLKGKPGNPLKQLNIISKMVVCGIMFDTVDETEKHNILLLEIKKDSCVVSCNSTTIERLSSLNDLGGEYTRFLLGNNFAFHTKKYNKYVRSNKTSLFITDDGEYIRKGHYKYCPKKLNETIQRILMGEEYNKQDLLKIFSKPFWDVVRVNNLSDILEDYYICEPRKVLAYDGKYQTYNINVNVDPRLYLKLFVFPAILSNMLE